MSNTTVLSPDAERVVLAAPGPLAPLAVPSPPTRPPPPAVRSSSIADRVARTFPPLACVRGFRYFSRRRVVLSNVSDAALDAEVKGKRTQQVKLRIEEGRLAAACTCASKVLGPATCRHVWATLLEVDRQGAFASLRGTQRVLALGILDGQGPKRRRPVAEAAGPAATVTPTKKTRGKQPARVKKTT